MTVRLKPLGEVIADLKAAIVASRAARGACVNLGHEHGRPSGAAGVFLCGTCGSPSHYDLTINSYRHNAGDVSCRWFQGARTPCQFAPMTPEPIVFEPGERCPFCHPRNCDCWE
jgi:uncharacterized protein YodC (DUF2158 family)